MKAEDLLPNERNEAVFDGVTVRKGSVGAFIANATLWMDPLASATDKRVAEGDMADALPALRALKLLELFAARDEKLQQFIDAH